MAGPRTTIVFANAAAQKADVPGARGTLTGCPWYEVKTKLREVGLRPTRQRMALDWMLFGKGNRHVTAEMLHEEALNAKVQVSLATIYNSSISSRMLVCCGKSRSMDQKHFSTPTLRSTIISSLRTRTDRDAVVEIAIRLTGNRSVARLVTTVLSAGEVLC